MTAWDVRESHSAWARIKSLADEWNALDIESTLFSEAERTAAQELSISPDWLFSYPQPEGAYLPVTYDLADYCRTCGTGATQIAPFRLIRAPRWQKRRMFALNWVFDEFFVEPTTYASIFEPLGVGSWPVHDRRGKPLADVVQLRIDDVVELDRTGLTSTSCPTCARPTYDAVLRGSYPALIHPTSGPIVRGDAWFGSGGSGWRLAVASAAVYRSAAAADVQGVTFRPLASRDIQRR